MSKKTQRNKHAIADCVKQWFDDYLSSGRTCIDEMIPNLIESALGKWLADNRDVIIEAIAERAVEHHVMVNRGHDDDDEDDDNPAHDGFPGCACHEAIGVIAASLTRLASTMAMQGMGNGKASGCQTRSNVKAGEDGP